MKRFLIAVSFVLMAFTASADNSVDDVLKQIAQNNLTLRALQHDNEADVLDIKAENSLGGLSVEYSPFFRSGYSGVATGKYNLRGYSFEKNPFKFYAWGTNGMLNITYKF